MYGAAFAFTMCGCRRAMARVAAHVAAALLLADSAGAFHVASPGVFAHGGPLVTSSIGARTSTSRPLMAPAPLNVPLNRPTRYAGSLHAMRASGKLDAKTERVKVDTVVEGRSSTSVPEMDVTAYVVVGLCCLCGKWTCMQCTNKWDFFRCVCVCGCVCSCCALVRKKK